MGLNIKNHEAHRLASLLALVEELQRFVAELPDRDPRPADEILGYDEFGLPG
jgi:hypothetical protein